MLACVVVVVLDGSVLHLAAGVVACVISAMAYSEYQP